LSGKRRLIARAPGAMTLFDVASDGRSALISTGAAWWDINAAIDDEPKERSLDHLGRTAVRGLSADGKWLLMNEEREEDRGTWLRSTDGEQTLRLGGDIGRGLSPDGAWVLVQTRDSEPRLKLLPKGAGASKDLQLSPGLVPLGDYTARWSRNGRRLFVPFT
jgi:hypothetical protein